MALINPKIVLNTAGYGTNGWTFAILGDYNNATNEYQKRLQGDNPVFTLDSQNQAFAVGLVYLLTMLHPQYCPDERVVRVKFQEDGTLLRDPAETPTLPLTPGPDPPDRTEIEETIDEKIKELPRAVDVQAIVYQTVPLDLRLISWVTDEQPDL